MSTIQPSLTASETKREIKAIQAAGRKIRRTPETAREFLRKHGFITAKGQLAKRFRG